MLQFVYIFGLGSDGMSLHRAIAVPMLFGVLSACASSGTAKSPAIAPKDGPKASINANYTGGIFSRQAYASFKVGQLSYVMVAHLSGEGRLRILYPESPRSDGLLAGGKWYRTSSIPAHYDAAPELFAFRPAVFRSLGAQSDSYDGIGHGYIFMIASSTPLRFDRISEFGYWDDLELPNYLQLSDPRESIRDFAEDLVGGRRYTLDYASHFQTFSWNSLASQQWDCAMLSTMGLISGQFWGGLYHSRLGRRLHSCSNSLLYAGYDRGWIDDRNRRYAGTPSWTPVSPAPTTPRTSPTPRGARPPGFRPVPVGDEDGGEVATPRTNTSGSRRLAAQAGRRGVSGNNPRGHPWDDKARPTAGESSKRTVSESSRPSSSERSRPTASESPRATPAPSPRTASDTPRPSSPREVRSPPPPPPDRSP